VLDAELLQRAVEIDDLDRLDFADAYLVASAQPGSCAATRTERLDQPGSVSGRG
jgi:hypothetical protein